MIRISGYISNKKTLDFSTKIFDASYNYQRKYLIKGKKILKLILHSKNKIDFDQHIFEDQDKFIFSFDKKFINNLKNPKKYYKEKNLFFIDSSTAIYFDKRKKIFIKRSLFSANAVYYHKKNNNIFFSSEIKILLENSKTKFKLCKKILVNFLCRNYRLVFGRGYTFFNNIFEIKTAHYIDFNAKNINQKNYWLPSTRNNFKRNPIIEFKRSLNLKISESLRTFKKPIFLVSGGLDSTFIASFAKKILKQRIHTVSATFKNSKKFDESFYIKKLNHKIAKKSFYINMSSNFFVKWLKKKEKIYDQPLLSPVYLLMNYIFFFINKKKYDGVFGGGGGDILSMGTYEYQPYIFADYLKISKKEFNKQINSWNKNQKNLIGYWPTNKNGMLELIKKITGKKGRIFHNPDWTVGKFNILNKNFFSKKDLTYVPSIKYKFPKYIQSRVADEILAQAMPTHFIEELNICNYNITGSDPFLDKDLVEKCFNLRLKHLTANGYAKVLFRRASKGILPDVLRMRKERTGLSVPIDDWFVKGPLNVYFKKLLNNKANTKTLNIRFIKKVLKEHEQKENDYSWILWRLLSFMIWIKNFNGYLRNK